MAVGLGVFLGKRCADSLPSVAPGAGHSRPVDVEQVGVERAESKSLEMQKEQALELGRTRGRFRLCH